LLASANAAIDFAVQQVEEEKKKKKIKDEKDDDCEWENYSPGQSPPVATEQPLPSPRTPRSIFSDVDE
jgi:hypothetical protein